MLRTGCYRFGASSYYRLIASVTGAGKRDTLIAANLGTHVKDSTTDPFEPPAAQPIEQPVETEHRASR